MCVVSKLAEEERSKLKPELALVSEVSMPSGTKWIRIIGKSPTQCMFVC